MKHPLQELIERHKTGDVIGIYSVCSANPFVLEAAVQQAKADETLLLIEATSNQVDQFGGYTGMKPQDFAFMVKGIAQRFGLPADRLILGGDHLGPNRWRNLEPDQAMAKAREQIQAYLQAGFSKIHLDASMPLKGDVVKQSAGLPAEVVARRSAEMCAAAEEVASEFSNEVFKPIYVIGTDVPVPGGAVGQEESLRITPVDEVEEVLQTTRQAFWEKGLSEAWERTRAIVVQPGVEFGDAHVVEYSRDKARALTEFITNQQQFVYEAHSTDYQRPSSLRAMVEDHFTILKVGPALTFAFREAIFALSFIEEILAARYQSLKPSGIRSVVEAVMLKDPRHWQKYYQGTDAEQAFARQFSFSDRIRYYWPDEQVKQALKLLFQNLRKYGIPLALVSQFLPEAYRALREHEIENTPVSMIRHRIRLVLQDYAAAADMGADTGFLVPD